MEAIMGSNRTTVDWVKIKFEFVHSHVQVAELSRQHGVKEDTIWKRCTREGWNELRVVAEQKAYADAAGIAAKDRVKDLTNFNQADLSISRALRNRVAKRLADENKTLTTNELRLLASTAEVAQRMGRLALGASTDNVGVGGPGGDGPVEVANVSRAEYLKARAEVLQDF